MSPAGITIAAAASENSALTYCSAEKPSSSSRAICGSTRLTIDISTAINATPSDSISSPTVSRLLIVAVDTAPLSDRNIRFR